MDNQKAPERVGWGRMVLDNSFLPRPILTQGFSFEESLDVTSELVSMREIGEPEVDELMRERVARGINRFVIRVYPNHVRLCVGDSEIPPEAPQPLVMAMADVSCRLPFEHHQRSLLKTTQFGKRRDEHKCSGLDVRLWFDSIFLHVNEPARVATNPRASINFIKRHFFISPFSVKSMAQLSRRFSKNEKA